MIDLTLPTMTCGHCVKSVTETVQRIDPAARVQIDLPTHHVRIDSERQAADFRDALAKEGYSAAE